MTKLGYEPRTPAPGGPSWAWPGWTLALAWVPTCLVAAFAGAYVAEFAFWEQFLGSSWEVFPGRILFAGVLAAASALPVLVRARLAAVLKLGIAILIALPLAFAVTLFSLFELWGP